MDPADRPALERQILRAVHDDDTGGGVDSRRFAEARVAGGAAAHAAVMSACRSLASAEMITVREVEVAGWALTDEGAEYADRGSPEYQLLVHVARAQAAAEGPAGVTLASLYGALGKALVENGKKQAMEQRPERWVSMSSVGKEKDKVTYISANVDPAGVRDGAREALRRLRAGGDHGVGKDEVAKLKKRKLVRAEKARYYVLGRGEKFALERRQQLIDLSQELIASGAWREMDVKEYNFDALGVPPAGGHLHPLLKVREQFRQIFLQMGFSEMPTNNFVESSFWNFDALFQPQMHPARDAHDTFFISGASSPARARAPLSAADRAGADPAGVSPPPCRARALARVPRGLPRARQEQAHRRRGDQRDRQ